MKEKNNKKELLKKIKLQKDIEDKIAYARQFYNDSVLSYKNKLEMFPTNIVAGMFNFQPKPFFEVTGQEREAVKVSYE